ncbi:hypothetical protein TWF730_003772 [Orbilia blumenaviensis]|uniref:Fucose-specific lectin n=1 Tax=Orbilia blumenaviensis TaxID=1796055 RepID=A0AAV9U767_9PEZI
MGSYNLRIKNQSSTPRSYVIYSEEIYILESVKKVIVSPTVSPGGFCDVQIEDKYYVWAEVKTSSQRTISELEVGTAIVLKNSGRQVLIEQTNLTPEPDYCLISVDPSFEDCGSFGIGVNVSPAARLYQLTAKEASEVTVHNIQPKFNFEVAVNNGYQDGDELYDYDTEASPVTVEFGATNRAVTLIDSGSGAGSLSVEDPLAMKELQEALEQLKVKDAERSHLLATSVEQERIIKEMVAAVVEQEQRLSAMTAAAAQKDKEIADLTARVLDQERRIAELVVHAYQPQQPIQSLPPGHSITATAWSAWHVRVYFQDSQGGVRESRHDDGRWAGGDTNSILFVAKLGTPLAAINWNSGAEIRIYYLSPDDHLQEYCYSAGHGWSHGNINNHSFTVASYSKIGAIHMPIEPMIRLWVQEPNSKAIQEYYYSSRTSWKRGETLWEARAGSSIAATQWSYGEPHWNNVPIRLYFQDEQSYIRELCWQGGRWSAGQFCHRVGRDSPLAASSWYHRGTINIRIFWMDNHRTVYESAYVDGWNDPCAIARGIDGSCALGAVKFQTGKQQRLYLREGDALVEKCVDGHNGSWFGGRFVIR